MRKIKLPKNSEIKTAVCPICGDEYSYYGRRPLTCKNISCQLKHRENMLKKAASR
ncbi:MAG: hypothetical protein JRJ62_16040 [Deltaproteobacteria bacterium]|nr:hypothetical protein [Deltaproteobacteria bacterium]